MESGVALLAVTAAIAKITARSIAARTLVSVDRVPSMVVSWEDLETAATDSLMSQRVGGHADEIETSIILALRPELVKMNRAVRDDSRSTPPAPGYRPGGYSRRPGDPDHSATGITGDPTLATAEKGPARIADHVASVDPGVQRLCRDAAAAASLGVQQAGVGRYVYFGVRNPELQHRLRRVASVVAITGLLACKPRDASIDTPAVTARDTAVGLAGASVTARGIGPLQMGMTLMEARAVLPGLALPPGSDASGCEFARSPALLGVLVMIEDGIVVRVDVDTNSVATSEGIRVGDTVSRVRSVYGSRLTATPNKYTSEPDLRVQSSIPEDTLHEIIFETLAGKVRHYHAGRRPQVRYLEGCS